MRRVPATTALHIVFIDNIYGLTQCVFFARLSTRVAKQPLGIVRYSV